MKHWKKNMNHPLPSEPSSPIGILDSGLGGLSVLNEIRALMPDEDIIYVGDSAWCPYGARSADEIQKRVFTITDFLLEKGCKLIVIACNSATINAVEALRAAYPLPFVGMEPGVKPAVAITKSGTIGILATEASLAGEKFHRLVDTHSRDIKVITRPAPRFVELVEKGELNGEHAHRIVKEETTPLIEAGADTIVLGCTHYPFLKPLIQSIAGDHIQILDTGAAVAKQTSSIISRQEKPLTQTSSQASYHIYTTADLKHAQQVFPDLCPDVTNAVFKKATF